MHINGIPAGLVHAANAVAPSAGSRTAARSLQARRRRRSRY